MRNRKRQKTIDDISVSKLLDDFIRFDASPSQKTTDDMDDEEYIKMMLRKHVQRERERTRRERILPKANRPRSTQKDFLDEDIRRRFFPDMNEESSATEKTTEENIVNEILDSLTAEDVSDLAAMMREAVDFVENEMGTSEAERRLAEALERCRETLECEETVSHISNDNVLVLKRCQNCFYCAGEQTRRGSVWCLCDNQDRTLEVETDDSWVKNSINLSCWTPQET